MAHKKGGGSTRNGRDSQPKYLGVKMYGGQYCISGNIIVRQHGTHFHPGENVRKGRDNTLYAVADGVIHFNTARGLKRVHVLPLTIGAPNE